MKLNFKFLTLLIGFCALSFNSAWSQIKFPGTEFPGAALEFIGDPNGETSIPVQASGNLPSGRYNFELSADNTEQIEYIEFSSTFLHFDNKRSNEATATLTEMGLAELSELGSLSIPFYCEILW